MAKQCSTFVNSFILDSDIVPRLSLNNMEYLRDEVLRSVARRVKLSTYEIARRGYYDTVRRSMVSSRDMLIFFQFMPFIGRGYYQHVSLMHLC